jgi:hypothetical protein
LQQSADRDQARTAHNRGGKRKKKNEKLEDANDSKKREGEYAIYHITMMRELQQ